MGMDRVGAPCTFFTPLLWNLSGTVPHEHTNASSPKTLAFTLCQPPALAHAVSSALLDSPEGIGGDDEDQGDHMVDEHDH